MIIYISGPMSGLPEFNFPAFTEAAKKLRELGHIVISPHEIEQPALTWEACMRQDIKQLMDADMVVVLPGWEKSKGANIEVDIAIGLGMQIIRIKELIPWDLNPD